MANKLCLAALILILPTTAVLGEQERTPNIVLILADDLGVNQLGCYGSTFYETPHIDSLANTGMRFTDAYAACPVCSPTRASIMTGKYPARLHLTEFIAGNNYRDRKLLAPEWTKYLPLEEVTLAETLRAAGYATGHFGKWHLNRDKKYAPGRPGDPGSQGFDDVLTTHKPGAGPRSKYDDDWHHVRAITERTLEFMTKHRDQPFFAYVTHNSIHRPLREREELVQKYQDKAESSVPENDPTIAAMLETLDRSVGRILEHLDELDLADETVVVFFSDNGSICGRDVLKPWRGGKSDLYEGGIRVPLVVRWPGVIPRGSVCSVPVTSVDLLPTFTEMANARHGGMNVDGVSLRRLLEGQGAIDERAIYWHYPHYHSQSKRPGGAIRKGDLKLIEWFDQSADGLETEGALELFDLKNDPSEQNNLVAQLPEEAADLHRDLAAWRKRVGAQEMSVNPVVRFDTSGDDRIVVHIDDDPVATFVYRDPDISRPYFAHLRTADGTQVTRNHPPIPGQDVDDHAKYHPGLWMSFGDISGSDFWRLKAPTEFVRFVEAPKGGPNQGGFVAEFRYGKQGATNETVCRELFRFQVRRTEYGDLLIWDSTFTGDQPFAFGDQEEMGLGIRVATGIRADHDADGAVPPGKGSIVDSLGRKDEKQVWGHSAPWCDYRGPIGEQIVGITIMCHPANFRPSWYHARDYGLLLANPFGRKAFRQGDASRIEVASEEPLRLRYGVLLHSSPKDDPVDLRAAYGEYLRAVR